MKTKTLPLLLTAVLALTACASKKEMPVSFEQPAFQASAALFTAEQDTDLPVSAIELTESGLYILYPPKASHGEKPFIGKYTPSGDGFLLQDYGSLKVIDGKAGSIRIILKTATDEYEIPCTMTQGTPDDLFRTWTIEKTRIVLSTGSSVTGMDFQGCNLAQVNKFLKDNGVTLNVLLTRTVQDVTLTAAGTFLVRYTDGSADKARWDSFKGNTLTYSWTDGSQGFSIDDGKATVEYADGRCIFSVSTKLSGTGDIKSANVIFVLKD